MEREENFVCDILNYGASGEGVSKTIDGKVAFIPYSIIGEKVFVKVLKSCKSYVNCSVKEIVKPSNFRIKPECKYYEKCGGCQLQHMGYNESLNVKRNIVQNAINKIGKINCNVLPVIASDLTFGYRNKLSLYFDYDSKKLAMHDINNNLITVDDCVITQSWCKTLITLTNYFVKQYNLAVYNPKTNKGLLKQLIARKTGETLLVTLVVNSNNLPNYDDYFAMLLTEFEKVGLSINSNTKPRNYLPIGINKTLCGEADANVAEFGLRYSINNDCFMQVNSGVKEKIYNQIIDETKGFDLCLDCYSGAGVLTALVSKNVKKAIGVEIVEAATNAANLLMKTHNILNVQNVCGDSSEVLKKYVDEIKANNSVVILDPPRKGCDEKILQTLNEVCAQKIVYVSCEPSTLARDLNVLCASVNSKYKINFVRPYDMFPQTKHVETVVVLGLK